MSRQDSPKSLSGVLDDSVEKTEGERVSLGDLMDSFGSRSYGPPLMFFSLIAMVPIIGGIPGMSVLLGILVMLLAGQLVFLRSHPWLPKRLLAKSFSRDKLTEFVEKVRPVAKWLGKFVGPRLTFLDNPPFLNIAGVICFVLGALFLPMALAPFAVLAPAAAVFLFGLGMTARDGVAMLTGLALTGLAIWALVYFWPTIVETVQWVMSFLGFAGSG